MQLTKGEKKCLLAIFDRLVKKWQKAKDAATVACRRYHEASEEAHKASVREGEASVEVDNIQCVLNAFGVKVNRFDYIKGEDKDE